MSVGQTDFTAAILDSSRDVPLGLADPQGRPAGSRFSVYRNNVAVSLTAALETAFPVIHKLVGTEFFQAMSGVYLRQHPPSTPLMMFYGAEMPAFLREFEPVKHLGYLPDVARLELALRHSYHAADSVPISPDELQALPPERLMAARLTLAPAVRLVQSEWPVFSVWLSNTQADAPAPTMQAEAALITRANLDPAPALVDASGAAFIEALGKGLTFGYAVHTAGESFDLTATLGILLAGNAIIGISEED